MVTPVVQGKSNSEADDLEIPYGSASLSDVLSISGSPSTSQKIPTRGSVVRVDVLRCPPSCDFFIGSCSRLIAADVGGIFRAGALSQSSCNLPLYFVTSPDAGKSRALEEALRIALGRYRKYRGNRYCCASSHKDV